MKTASGIWSSELWVYCPYCEDFQEIDTYKIDDVSEIPGLRAPEKCDNVNYLHTCDNEECGKEFKITETNY